MQVVYAKEPLPSSPKSLFLAGPTPRSSEVLSWRVEALRHLQEAKFDGLVFTPEPRDGQWAGDYTDQIEWETEGLQRAVKILFWIPREMKTLPGLTTNIEWGIWAASGKVVLGTPPEAEHVRYIRHMARKLKVATFNNLPEAIYYTVMTLEGT